MTTGKPVLVRQLPHVLDVKQAQAFFQELQPFLECDRPCLVFDFSEVRQMHSAGVDLLLRCVEEAMKRNGDLKLAAVSPQLSAVLEMTRVDRLFEIFENSNDAVESFHRFPTRTLQSKSTLSQPEFAKTGGTSK